MPNWCITRYKCCSQGDEAQQLYDIMKGLQDAEVSRLPNGFGTNWLGNLVDALGADPKEVGCRGSWNDLQLYEDCLSFYTETAWYRCTEVEDLIRETFPDLNIYFMCEEPGMAIYETNDSSGQYFPEEYIIEVEGEEDYYTAASAIDMFSDFFDDNFESMKDVMASVDKYNENAEAEDFDDQIYVHEISVID